MSWLLHFQPMMLAGMTWRLYRHYLVCGAVAIGVLLAIHLIVLEPYQIPTGSMAPALHGHHRVCACPRCGHEVAVGRMAADAAGSGAARYYKNAFCSNCGLFPLPLAATQEVEGNRVLVNKTAFLLRPPERWEVVVFRFLGALFIKRLLGLPGEELSIRDGDLYVDGKLMRKDLEVLRRMRVSLFDQQHAPPGGWEARWTSDPNVGGLTAQGDIMLEGRITPQTWTYRNYSLDLAKCQPLRDEYAYNGCVHPDSEYVHDFMVETEIEVIAGSGAVALRLCDGRDWIEVLLPVGERRPAEAFRWPVQKADKTRKVAETQQAEVLLPGRRYRVEMAFVDRRISLAVDGQTWLRADLNAASDRPGVEQPLQVQAEGVRAVLRGLRLYRDVHYGQQGTNAVRGNSVRLGMDQYFLLGDNSPTSQDSRFWPDQGRVDGCNLIGSAWLAYGSSPLRRLR